MPDSRFPPPVFKNYWLSQCVGWGFFLILRLATTAAYLARRPEINVFEAYGWEVADHAAMAVGSHLVWSYMLRRRLFEKGWKALFCEGFAAALLVSAAVTAALWQPCVAVYEVDFARVGFEAMVWFMSMQHALVMVLWFSAMLAIFYFERTRTLEVQRAEAASAAHEAQLHALKGQINPHFLFNCFNSLRALIDEDPSRARDAVTQLSVILRYSLTSSERKVVPLAEELHVVSLYLELEKLRLGPRLEVSMNVSPDAMHAFVPPLLLQSLIENAVKFGPASRKQGGAVTCSAGTASGMLCIQVTNTGRLGSSSDSTGTGLKNLRDRLRLIYGPAASFAISETASDQVTASVIMPMNSPTLH